MVRLSKFQKKIIKETFKEVFGQQASIFLFGSRVDDNLKGGDIDLLVDTGGDEPNFDSKLKFQTLLQLRMGDQKIDVVVSQNSKKDKRLVVQEAVSKGLLL